MRNRKRGGTVTATMSVIRNYEDIEIEVSGYFNPEQNGGWDEPSWSAYVEFEGAMTPTATRSRSPMTRSPTLNKDAGGSMKAKYLIDLFAVVLATSITAFLIVACWSLLGGIVTYLIALLVGGTLLYVWSGSNDLHQ